MKRSLRKQLNLRKTPNMWGAILPLLQTLLKSLSTLFAGFFLVKTGKEKQQLEDYKKEEKNVKKSKTLANSVDAMSDDELRELLDGAARKKD